MDEARHGGPTGLFTWQILFLAYVCGLFVLEDPWPAVVALVLLLFFLLAAARLRPTPALLVLVFVGGLGATWLAMPVPPTETPGFMLTRDKAMVWGRVDDVDTRPGQRLQAVLSDVRYRLDDGQEGRLHGRLVWTWEHPPVWPDPGQVVSFKARIRPIRSFANLGGWDYAAYYARQSVYWRAFSLEDEGSVSPDGASPVWRARRHLLEGALSLPTSPGLEQGRAVVLALVTGERYLLDPAKVDLVRRASLLHALALSGFNVVFVASFGFGAAWLVGRLRPSMFLRFPRPKLSILLGAPIVLWYLWLGGLQTSLTRAVVMYCFWGGLLLLGRGRATVDGLFIALAAMLLPSPITARDTSLQLSILAVAGLIFLYGPVQGWLARTLGRGRLGRAALAPLAVLGSSLCVQIVLLPVLAASFGQINPHIHLNVIWLPVMGWASLPLGLTAIVLAPVTPEVAAWCMNAGAWTMQVMLGNLAWLDHVGWLGELTPLRPLWPEALGYWTLLAVAVLWRDRELNRAAWATVGLGLALLVGPHLAVLVEDGQGMVRLSVLDVGQGQSLLITAPSGRRVLVDGGGFGLGTFDVGQAVVGPTLTYGRPPVLDRIMLSHPDADHLFGLFYPLRTFSVGGFAFCNTWPGSAERRTQLEAYLAGQGIEPQDIRTGDVVDLGDGLILQVLHPSRSSGYIGSHVGNNESLVMRLAWRGRGLAILPGDVEKSGIRAFLDNRENGNDISADVLVLPHHGSKSSLSLPLYDRVRPRWAVASAELLNQWGMPNKDVVSALAKRKIPLYWTGAHGQITVEWSSPGAEGRVTTAR